MKFRDVSDLANLTAAVGVIVSLLFVGYEIRQNTIETRATTAASVGESFRELTMAVAQSPSLAATLAAYASGDQFTPTQQMQYFTFLISLIRTVEDAYIQYGAGRLDEDQLQVRVAGLGGYVGDQRGRDLYNVVKNGGIFSADFTRWLDEQLAETYGE